MTWSRAHGSKAGNQAPYLAQPPSCRPPTLQAAKTDVFARKCTKCVPSSTMGAKWRACSSKIPGRDRSSTAFSITFRNRVRTSCVFTRRLNTSMHSGQFSWRGGAQNKLRETSLQPTAQDASARQFLCAARRAGRHPRTSHTACNHLLLLGRHRRRARHREFWGRTSKPFGRRRS